MMEDWQKDRIGSAVNGKNPRVLLKMKSGFAVIGDSQFLPGYCVLLAYPRVNSLNDLNIKERSNFLVDMSLLGDAIQDVCKPLRINYSILGNADTYLHAHIHPRYDWEPAERKHAPAWLYPKEYWTGERYQFNETEHGELKALLTKRLGEIIEGMGKEDK